MCSRAVWIWVLTRSGRSAASGSNTLFHWAWPRISTLSGGAAGWAPTGAPTFWNRESAWGRSTTPSTTTSTGAMPARPMWTVSPGAHVGWRRFVVQSGPRCRRRQGCGWRRETARGSSGGCPIPLPGRLFGCFHRSVRRIRWSGHIRPVAPLGRCADRTVSRTVDGWVSGWTSTCQSTVTLRMARAVIEPWAAARKLPRQASRATAAAIPAAVAASRPRRRRSSPSVQVAIMARLSSVLGCVSRCPSRITQWSGSRAATAGSWVEMITAAPTKSRCPAGR